MTARPWTTREVETLRRLAPQGHRACMAALGRSAGSIAGAARRHRIRIAPCWRNQHMRRGVVAPAPMAHPLVRRLYDEMRRREISVRALAAAAGLDQRLPARWRSRAQPKLADLVAAFNALGLELVVVERVGRGAAAGPRAAE